MSLDAAIKAAAVLKARLSPDGAHMAAIVHNSFTSAVILVKTSDLTSRLLVTGTWERDGF